MFNKLIIVLLVTFVTLKADTLNIGLFGLDSKVANEKTVKRLMQSFLSKIDGLESLEVNIKTYYDEANLKQDYLENKINLFYMTLVCI